MAANRPPGDRDGRDQCIRVVCYARVNGTPADQTRLLGRQWERMRQFVRERVRWTIVGEFSDVATRRQAGPPPGLREALAEAVSGGDVFLVDSLDRVSRMTWEFAAAIEELGSANVMLRSAAEPFTDRNPDDLPTMLACGWTGSTRAHPQASRTSRMLRGRQ